MELNEAIKHCHEKAEEIRKANEEMPTDCKLSEDLCECANEHEQLAEWLTELQERREADRWKSVKERLPEQANQPYLVTVDYGNGIVGACQRYFFGEDIGWNDDCVVAWKPLPKPYESEREND